jgi:hypothetical protein
MIKFSGFFSWFSLFFILLFMCSNSLSARQVTMDIPTVKQKMNLSKLPFIENQGQIQQPDILYYTDTFKGRGLVEQQGRILYNSGSRTLVEIPNTTLAARVKGQDKSLAQINYLIGSDPKKHKKNIPAFNELDFGTVWPDISLRIQARAGAIEKFFHVAPHADPSAISMEFDNALSVNITPEGQLVVNTASGPVKFTRPRAFQHIDGNIHDVETAYMLLPGENSCRYGFVVGAYDKGHELVIDPLLAGTYFGGDNRDKGYDIALNSLGDVYITGYTRSESLPSTGGAFQTDLVHNPEDNHRYDAFVAKFTSDLSLLTACTYFGGSKKDVAVAMTIDSNDRVWIAGETNSCADFPTTSTAFEQSDPEFGWCDAGFVAKFSGGNLGYLESSTLITAGNHDVFITSIDIDSNLKPYIAGFTESDEFPVTARAYQTEKHDGYDPDGFVAKLEWDLSAVTAATYLAGSKWDTVTAIDVKADGVYVAGHTDSADFITCAEGAGGATQGQLEGFVAKLNTDLTWMMTSRFLGGSDNDDIQDLVVEGDNVFVTGRTESSNFPVTQGAYNIVFPEAALNRTKRALFISALSNTDLTLKNSTFLGVVYYKGGIDILTDESGTIYIAGITSDENFPTTPGAFDESGADDLSIFISKMDTSLKNLAASTLLGDSNTMYLEGMARNKKGEIFVQANTFFDERFPVTDTAWKKGNSEDDFDVVIARLDEALSTTIQYPKADLSTGHLDFGLFLPGGTSELRTITISNSGDGDLVLPDTGITQSSDQFIIEDDLCSGHTIQPGETCSFGVRFTPKSIGIKTATAKINSSAGPLSLTLSGEGRLLGDLDKSGQVDLVDMVLSLKPLAAKRISKQTADEDITGDPRDPFDGYQLFFNHDHIEISFERLFRSPGIHPSLYPQGASHA